MDEALHSRAGRSAQTGEQALDLSNKPLRCFVAVAETQSFTHAAERLHMTQPSLSIQVSQLEKRLGCQLFERTTREVVITPAGRRLLDYARRVIDNSCLMLNEARSIRDEQSNRLRLGAALYTFDLPERAALVEGFIDAHPEIDLRVDSRHQSETIRDLRSHDLDLALILGIGLSSESYDSGDGGELTYPRPFLQAVLRQERVELRIPVDHELARYDEVPMSALNGQRIVIPSDGHGVALLRPIRALLSDASAEAILPPEATSAGSERYGLKHHLPVVTFGWFRQSRESRSSTVLRPIAGFDLRTDFVLLAHEGEQTPAMREFIAYAVRRQGDATLRQ